MTRSLARKPTGKPTCRVVSSGWRSSMNARPSAMPRPAPLCGPSPIRCRAPRAALYTNRRDLVADYPTYEDRQAYRLPTLYASIQKQDFSKDYPIILTSGRLVEYEGGGDETRSNPWLAELQQDMFVEINPAMPTTLGFGTARRCGSKGLRAARSRSWPWSPSGWARASPSCPSTSAAIIKVRTFGANTPRCRPLCFG